jgi:hypothetical protein
MLLDISVLKWLVGINIVLNLAICGKLVLH